MNYSGKSNPKVSYVVDFSQGEFEEKWESVLLT